MSTLSGARSRHPALSLSPMGPSTNYYIHRERFVLYRGSHLPGVQLAWESWGTLNDDKSNAVLLFTGLSPGAHAASSVRDPEPGWWEAMVGPGKPIDTDRHFVLCVNSLGSCQGSTGPASINPATGQPWRLKFPHGTSLQKDDRLTISTSDSAALVGRSFRITDFYGDDWSPSAPY
ncbi:MAG: hypothetical protein WDZ60_09495, partial [Wenzhouxiangellaceae bacterium]